MKKHAHSENKLLTDVELELMTILWRVGEGNVAEVIAHLNKERKLAYTSVSTILRILEQKEFLTTRKEGRGHVYIPLVAKDEYESRSVRDMVDRVFDGTPLALAKQLINTVGLSKQDLQELKKLIENSSANTEKKS
jgi:predicted transcriptional regulator